MNHVRHSIILTIFSLALLSACTPSPESRSESASQLASEANLQPLRIATTQYMLMGWQRSSEAFPTLRVYIEGDGFAWRNPTLPSLDPTPLDPVALKLAIADESENVVYLARPCQFYKARYCTPSLWTNLRFSQRVLESYQAALDSLKAQHNATHIELVGFSGGGVVTALLAAHRDDVVNFRTVSTPIDTRVWTTVKHFSPLKGSLNPGDYLAALANIPQAHFWGEDDSVVPRIVLENYQERLPQAGRCSAIYPVSGLSHQRGWPVRWPELQRIKPYCRNLLATSVAN